MENNIEFEEMKQQLSLLQQRLDKQVEINERQTRRAIENGMGNLRKKDLREFRFCVAIAIIMPIVIYLQKLPLYFVIGTFIFLLGNAAWKYYRRFNDNELAGLNLIDMTMRLVHYKKVTRNSILIGLPVAIGWAFWYAIELSNLPELSTIDLHPLYIAMVIGGILGFVLGLKLFFFPAMRAADNLLRQIEDVQGEK